MRAFFLLACLVITFDSFAQNILQNPGFEKGASHWILGKYNGIEAVMSIEEDLSPIENHVAQVRKKAFTSNHRDIKLFQPIELQKNKVYELYFQAQISSNSPINIKIGNDLVDYWNESVVIQPSEKQYGPFYFESHIQDQFAAFSFELGDIGQEILLDSVILNEIDTDKVKELHITQNEKFQHTYHNQHLLIELNEAVDNYGIISIKDIRGNKVVTKDLLINQNEINIEGIPDGLYLVELSIDENFFLKKILLR